MAISKRYPERLSLQEGLAADTPYLLVRRVKAGRVKARQDGTLRTLRLKGNVGKVVAVKATGKYVGQLRVVEHLIAVTPLASLDEVPEGIRVLNHAEVDVQTQPGASTIEREAAPMTTITASEAVAEIQSLLFPKMDRRKAERVASALGEEITQAGSEPLTTKQRTRIESRIRSVTGEAGKQDKNLD